MFKRFVSKLLGLFAETLLLITGSIAIPVCCQAGDEG
jgi:hypothetical protein